MFSRTVLYYFRFQVFFQFTLIHCSNAFAYHYASNYVLTNYKLRSSQLDFPTDTSHEWFIEVMPGKLYLCGIFMSSTWTEEPVFFTPTKM